MEDYITAGNVLSYIISIIAIISSVIAWRKSGADIINTLQSTVKSLAEEQRILTKSDKKKDEELKSLRNRLEYIVADRDQWRKLARQYKAELAKAEKRISELKEITKNMKKKLEKWD
jgi:peptidoglycan hydrolase CwlO-like protein